jgi:hypothetical protein
MGRRGVRGFEVVLAAGALVVLGACGGGSDETSDGQAAEAGGSGGGDGACGVVDVAEVEEITGHEVGEASELPAGCQWAIDDGSGGAHEYQVLPRSSFDSNRESAGDAGFEVVVVAGMGDEAFLRDDVNAEGDLLQTELWVAVGDQAFFVRSPFVAPSDELQATHEDLAELLVERLG